MANITMARMLECSMHIGHKTSLRNPKMDEYIYGSRQGVHIINLEHSLPRLRELLNQVSQVVKKRGKVLFVGTKFSARDIVKEEAIRCGMPYVDNRWLGGMLTNYKTIRQSIKRLKFLEERLENKKFLSTITKKEALTLTREKDKLSSNLEGIKHMNGLPDMLFVIDVNRERIAVNEANCLKIPVSAIVDTNASPDGVRFVVPGNDDAMRSIRLYCQAIADTVITTRSSMELTEKKHADKKAQSSKKSAVVTKKESTAKADAPKGDDEAEKKPAAKKTVAKKKAVVKKTAAKKTAEKKPAAKKAAAKKPAAKKAAAKKPAAKKTKKESDS